MFVRKKQITTHRGSEEQGTKETRVKTLYLLDGQFPDAKTNHPATQKIYRALFKQQEKLEIEKGRPVTVYEQFGLINPDDL